MKNNVKKKGKSSNTLDISNPEELKPVYLVVGEAYFQNRFLQEIKQAVLGEAMNYFNYDKLDGRDYSLETVIQKAISCPLFTAKRLIVVSNAPYFEKSLSEHEEKQLLDYLANPAASTVLVFLTEKADKRKKLVKQFSKQDYLVEISSLKPWEVENWLKDRVKEFGIKMHGSALNLFLQKTGGNLQLMERELEKLSLYLMDNETVEVQDVEKLVPNCMENNVFKLVDKIGEKKITEAIAVLEELLVHEQPVKLLFMIARQARLITKMKAFLAEGYATAQASQALKVPPFVGKKLAAQSKNFTDHELSQFIKSLHETDYWIKTGQMEPKFSLERLLINLHAGLQSRENTTSQ